MKKTTQKYMVQFLLILSVIGMGLSLYLVKSHYSEASSFCDIREVASCTAVNTSIYSEWFHIPVAVFGVLWFVVVGFMLWNARAGGKQWIKIPLIWSVISLLFVIYFISREYLLNAFCIVCTAVHGLMVGMLVLLIILYRSKEDSTEPKHK